LARAKKADIKREEATTKLANKKRKSIPEEGPEQRRARLDADAARKRLARAKRSPPTVDTVRLANTELKREVRSQESPDTHGFQQGKDTANRETARAKLTPTKKTFQQGKDTASRETAREKITPTKKGRLRATDTTTRKSARRHKTEAQREKNKEYNRAFVARRAEERRVRDETTGEGGVKLSAKYFPTTDQLRDHDRSINPVKAQLLFWSTAGHGTKLEEDMESLAELTRVSEYSAENTRAFADDIARRKTIDDADPFHQRDKHAQEWTQAKVRASEKRLRDSKVCRDEDAVELDEQRKLGELDVEELAARKANAVKKIEEIIQSIQALGTTQADTVAMTEKYKADMAFNQSLNACGACGYRDYTLPYEHIPCGPGSDPAMVKVRTERKRLAYKEVLLSDLMPILVLTAEQLATYESRGEFKKLASVYYSDLLSL
jgi:hypothetical protein